MSKYTKNTNITEVSKFRTVTGETSRVAIYLVKYDKPLRKERMKENNSDITKKLKICYYEICWGFKYKNERDHT